jgi:hypothetical protein
MSHVREKHARGGGDFWSRRKARVAAEEAEAKTAEAAAEAAKSRAALEEKGDTEILAELELKDPDTLETGDDFSAFLRSEVPERLRRRALRRLWRSNAVLANLDSLVDYGEDYTDSARVVENLQTAYRVGKGMLSHDPHEAQAEVAAASPEDLGAGTLEDPVSEDRAPEDLGSDLSPEDLSPEKSSPEGVFAETSVAGPEETSGETVTREVADKSAQDRDAMPHTLRSPRRMKFSYT